MAFSERLAAMKSKQEAADQAKAEAEQAKKQEAERAAQAEKESKKGELSADRERVGAELASAEVEAQGADTAVAEAETFAAEQGENLDAEAKAEIDAIKQEAAAAKEKFENLKAEAARIDAELSTLESGEPVPAETVTETPAAEASVEAPVEAPAAEKPLETPAEAQKTEKFFGADDIKEYLAKFSLDEVYGVESMARGLENIPKKQKAKITTEGLTELQNVQAKMAENPKFQEQSKRLSEVINGMEHYLNLRDNPKYLKEAAQIVIEKMKTGNVSMQRDGRRNLSRLIDDSQAVGPVAMARLTEALETQPLDIVKEKKTEKQKQRDEVSKIRGEALPKVDYFQTEGFHDIPKLAAAIETVDPQKADKYHEFFVNGLVDSLKDKKPAEVRVDLFARGDRDSVVEELGTLLKRMDKGEGFSPDLEKAIAQLLPILEASDKIEEVKFPQSGKWAKVKGTSEFLTDPFLFRSLDRGGTEEDEMNKQAIDRVRKTLNEIKAKNGTA
ncbi:MAG: hypothetical protein PHW53_01485 [Patescibacteria group bacterium]|nr:hypothetical protein [Patescibacteria group bacterium]